MAKQGEKGIPWCTQTWNIVTGCTPVSEGCRNCYAARMAKRLIGDFKPERIPVLGGSDYIWRSFSEVRTYPDRLEAPLHWRKPQRVFACSMGDLFHDAVPDAFIDNAFAMMAWCHQHVFQVLSKRARRMMDYSIKLQQLNRQQRGVRMARSKGFNIADDTPGGMDWPLRNVHFIVSVEDQKSADERIPYLLQTPAAVRGISLEPMLGEIGISPYLYSDYDKASHDLQMTGNECRRNKLSWVIIGCETGPGRRSMELEWAMDVIEQCQEAGVAVFVKQLEINGKVLKNPTEWPEEFRLRQFPEVAV